MGLFTELKDSVSRVTDRLFSEQEPKRIGIYGPPNAGKTTLANRIARDWTGDAVGTESHVPHETRRARRKENVEIERDGSTVTIDIVDTPGVTTKVDYEEFTDEMDEDDAIRRSREATEGVAEAMHWLREDVDGVIYVLDSAEDPITQVNTMLIGIIESRDLPVLIFANKIDLDDASVKRIEDASHSIRRSRCRPKKAITWTKSTITSRTTSGDFRCHKQPTMTLSRPKTVSRSI